MEMIGAIPVSAEVTDSALVILRKRILEERNAMLYYSLELASLNPNFPEIKRKRLDKIRKDIAKLFGEVGDYATSPPWFVSDDVADHCFTMRYNE